MKKSRYFALVPVFCLCLGLFSGCRRTQTDTPNQEPIDLADAVQHADDTSVYQMIGHEITIDMVAEDPDTGLATAQYGGTTYELGLDFLSMAMVYNCSVPEGGEYRSQEEVFNRWWKLYIQRWNYLVPEIPLYSNQFFDLYNAKLENFHTSPYRDMADAIVSANVRQGEKNQVILGSTTRLSGAFRNAAWGKSSAGAADADIEALTTGHATVQTDLDGTYVWNLSALKAAPEAVRNDDGTLTYTIRIRDNLLFSDGSPITAKNYIAGLLANSTKVAQAAGGSGTAGLTLLGYQDFYDYQGKGQRVYFAGVRLVDKYTFSVTYQKDYADYYYIMSYAAFTPDPLPLYLGNAEIVTDSRGCCGLSDAFYVKTEKNGAESFEMADIISNNLRWDSGLPYSGPYAVADYNAASLVATLTRNAYYSGDDMRGAPSIDTVTYVQIVSQTQLDQFKSGQVDVLAGITGAADTIAALSVVRGNPQKYAETHYNRAGYGKLGFRCDLGPTAMKEVRQAIMYTINRPEFAQTFTGGYGAVVHGPYYEGYSAYQAVEDSLLLNPYAYSQDAAVAVLEAGGWVYNGKGEAYTGQGVRYKKLSGYELSPDNLQFASTDGRYKTVKVDGAYYMPLAINWYGTQPNPVTDLLITSWQSSPGATTGIGMYITYTSSEFNQAVYGDLGQSPEYGFNGVPRCNAVNFATSFTSATYDRSRMFTIDQTLYANYSSNFLQDEADFWENYQG